jgi:hypothetical protein
VIGSGSHFFVALIVTLDCALQLTDVGVLRTTDTLVDETAFVVMDTRNTPCSDTVTLDVALETQAAFCMRVAATDTLDVAVEVTAAFWTRLTVTDALDVALAVTAARSTFCAVTVVEDEAVSETAASRIRCAETTALDAAVTVIDASLGSIP